MWRPGQEAPLQGDAGAGVLLGGTPCCCPGPPGPCLGCEPPAEVLGARPWGEGQTPGLCTDVKVNERNMFKEREQNTKLRNPSCAAAHEPRVATKRALLPRAHWAPAALEPPPGAAQCLRVCTRPALTSSPFRAISASTNSERSKSPGPRRSRLFPELSFIQQILLEQHVLCTGHWRGCGDTVGHGQRTRPSLANLAASGRWEGELWGCTVWDRGLPWTSGSPPTAQLAETKAWPAAWAGASQDGEQQKFHHPKLSCLRRENFIWNLRNVPLLEKHVDALGQGRNRELVVRVIQLFKDEVLTKLKHFRECLNHGDLNDHNILVEASKSACGDAAYQVSGILDFDDMSYGYYVFEAAITIMYMMIESKSPMHVGGHVLAGFESVIPLTPVERGALFLLVCSRFCQSLVMAAYSCQLHPENEEYLMITAKTGWKHLQQLFDLGQRAVEEIWFETARSYTSGLSM
ncbi:hydroxylysine kinase isoform X1 [Vulpes vulpes]|uniref:Hydroxylysine kinase n=1 Tax=Vulpes vulpes TaxID=9627 RepID=A0A3Q7SIZ6_VULVU